MHDEIHINTEQVKSILRNINRIIKAYSHSEFGRDSHLSEEEYMNLVAITVTSSIREVTSYIFHVCYFYDDEKQWIETINARRETLAKCADVNNRMKMNVLPICKSFCEKLAEIQAERSKAVVDDTNFKSVNNLGGVVRVYNDVVVLSYAAVSQYVNDVVDAIMKGVDTDGTK